MRDSIEILNLLDINIQGFDFNAALRLLENANPDKPRIGEAVRPENENFRFGQVSSMCLESAAIASFEKLCVAQHGSQTYHSIQTKPTQKVCLIKVNYFGLLGANGPMPLSFTQYVRDRERNWGDSTLTSFLDIFHHRMISLLYRAWACAQPTVSLDRKQSDRFSEYLSSLIGRHGIHKVDTVTAFSKIHYAGRLSDMRRNADGLASILTDYFQLPVLIQEFIGHWMTIPEDELCYLRSGYDAETLGITTVLGRKIWNCQHKFRIVIGPLDLVDFERMLPGGDRLERLKTWVSNYLGLTYVWDLKLILKKDAIKPLSLGKRAKLGWTSYLQNQRLQSDDRQLLINP